MRKAARKEPPSFEKEIGKRGLSGGDKGAQCAVTIRAVSYDNIAVVDTAAEGGDGAWRVYDSDTTRGEQEGVCDSGAVFKLAGDVPVVVNAARE
jgi:hypothetical protein